MEDFQAIFTGALVVAIGVAFIKQAGLLTGGTTGLAFLLHYSTGLNFGVLLFVANLPFYLLALWRMGWEFTVKTVLTVGLVALFTELLPKFLQISAIHQGFAAVSGGLLMGVGMLILFRHKASLGGFNVLALFLQDRFGIRAGKIQMLLDCLILVAAFQVVTPVLILYSILGAVLLNFALAVNHRPERYAAF